MPKLQLPAYLRWRDGRPRWEPGPGLRGAGWNGRDLKGADGAWLSLEAAMAAAKALNDEVAAAGGPGGGGRRHRGPARGAQRTVADLFHKWRDSPAFRMKADSTRKDYVSKAQIFVARFGRFHVAALALSHLHDWWEELHDERGHAMANGIIAVARTMLAYGRLKGWIVNNPACSLQLPGVPPRVVVWTPSEVEHYIAHAEALGFLALADAVVIALHTGQRQGDVLELELQSTESNRARFRQTKTGARVTVPFTDPLAARIAAIKRRRAELTGVVDLALARKIVLTPAGTAYTGDRLRKQHGIVREHVAKTFPDFATKQFLDLRDTAMTRLALAGCTVPEIRAISGHTLNTIHQVLEHYLALDDRMAQAGIDRLKAWMHEEGIAL